MDWTIEFTVNGARDVQQLDRITVRQIQRYLHRRVLASGNPRAYGRAMRGRLRGLWRYRVGDYRIICRIQDNILTVLVVRVGHRSTVYRGL